MFNPYHEFFAKTASTGHHDARQESAEKRMDADDFRAQCRKEDGSQDHSEDSFGWLRLVQKRSFKESAQEWLYNEHHCCHKNSYQHETEGSRPNVRRTGDCDDKG